MTTLDTIKREAKARGRAALNCVRGRPTVFRVHLVAPPALHLARDTKNALVDGCVIDNGDGVRVIR